MKTLSTFLQINSDSFVVSPPEESSGFFLCQVPSVIIPSTCFMKSPSYYHLQDPIQFEFVQGILLPVTQPMSVSSVFLLATLPLQSLYVFELAF